jgi:hypothetical protein
MARPRREQSDPRVIQDWIDEGRGTGRNGKYKTWLRIQDLASQGRSERLTSHITGDRIVHLLSGHESNAFFIFEWGPKVVDIREQYPLLPLEVTQEIARELNVEHPADAETRLPIVMTTDFLVTTIDYGGEKHHAFAIKESQELTSARTREKLEIARRYHEKSGERWGILTERDIPIDLARNLERLREKRDLSRFGGIPDETVTRVQESLLPILWKQEDSLANASAYCDKQLGLLNGTSLTIAFHLLYLRRWTTDLMQPLQPARPLVLQNPQLKEANEEVLLQFPAAMA